MSRILIADDHAFLRMGLEAVLASAGHEVVASVQDGLTAEREIARCDPDLAILDVRMPGKGGVDVLQSLRSAGDNRKVVLLTAALDDSALVEAIRAKVDAIVMKDEAASSLQAAISQVMRGQRAIALELMDRAFELAMASDAESDSAKAGPLDGLSDRDRRIAEGAAAGMRNRQIADELGISEGAVKTYLHRVFDRLGVSNRTELALLVTRAASASAPKQ